MKVKYYFVLMGIFLSAIISGCSSSKALTAEEAAQEAALRKAIENRELVVDVDRMLPMSGPSRSLTSSYSLEINGDKVNSNLPYFGRAYSVPYGGGDGLVFESTITDYQSSFDNKGKATIEFKTKTDEDQFIYRVEIFSNGSSSINVTSENRQSISFSGTASPKKAK